MNWYAYIMLGAGVIGMLIGYYMIWWDYNRHGKDGIWDYTKKNWVTFFLPLFCLISGVGGLAAIAWIFWDTLSTILGIDEEDE